VSNQVSVYVNFDGQEDVLTFCDEFESFYVVTYHDIYITIKDTSIRCKDNQIVGIFPIEVFRGAVFFDLEEEEFEEDQDSDTEFLFFKSNADSYVDNRGVYHEIDYRKDLPG